MVCVASIIELHIHICIANVSITLFNSQNLLMGTVSMMDAEVLVPTSFDAVTLN